MPLQLKLKLNNPGRNTEINVELTWKPVTWAVRGSWVTSGLSLLSDSGTFLNLWQVCLFLLLNMET